MKLIPISYFFKSAVLISFALLNYGYSYTVFVDTMDCFGLPESPISVAGAVVTGGGSQGRSTCYFSAPQPEQYISMRLEDLELPKTSGFCPSISIQEFSSTKEIILDPDPNVRVPMIVPADPKLLVRMNCTDFKQFNNHVLKTSSPGLRIELVFDPFSSVATSARYKVMLTSFVVGPSFNCPDNTFRCWNDRSKCIPESLTCDSLDNCFDNSDENGYQCTGRINGIPIPLFAIIIAVAFLLLVLIVTAVVFVVRKKKVRSKGLTGGQPLSPEGDSMMEMRERKKMY